MVGDDPSADIAAARRAGLRGVLVLTGKTSAATARAAGLAAGSVAADLRAVVAAAG
jgi:ribonucleotide monophosphatase NagD (HAD superfamily)